MRMGPRASLGQRTAYSHLVVIVDGHLVEHRRVGPIPPPRSVSADRGREVFGRPKEAWRSPGLPPPVPLNRSNSRDTSMFPMVFGYLEDVRTGMPLACRMAKILANQRWPPWAKRGPLIRNPKKEAVKDIYSLARLSKIGRREQ